MVASLEDRKDDVMGVDTSDERWFGYKSSSFVFDLDSSSELIKFSISKLKHGCDEVCFTDFTIGVYDAVHELVVTGT